MNGNAAEQRRRSRGATRVAIAALGLLLLPLREAGAEDTGDLVPSDPTATVAPGLTEQAPSQPIVDRAAVFRSHAELETEIEGVIASIRQQTGVRLYLVTLAFLADRSPQVEARQLARTWSPEDPAVVLLYVRGSQQAGIGTNPRLDAQVPDFEVAAVAPSSDTGKDLPDAEQLRGAVTELAALIRRYHTSGANGSPVGSDATARTKGLLLLVVLLAASAIVAVTAWACRRPTRANVS